MASDIKPSSVVVEVSNDRLSAACRIGAGLAPKGALLSEIAAAAQARGVKLDKDRLDALLPADRCAAEITKMEGQRKEAQKIRQTVEPLLRLQKNLTAAQKEKATVLLFNADKIDRQIADAVGELQQHALSLQANSRAELSVSRTIHAGTMVRFPRTEAAINVRLSGPVRIACAGHGAEWRVTVVGHAGSSFLLPSRSVPDKILDALAHLGATATAVAA